MEKIRGHKELQPARIQKLTMKAKDRDMEFKKRVKKMLDAKMAQHVDCTRKIKNNGNRIARRSIKLSGPVHDTIADTINVKIDPVKQILDSQLVNVIDINNVKKKKSKATKVGFRKEKNGLDCSEKCTSEAELGNGTEKSGSLRLQVSRSVEKPSKKNHEVTRSLIRKVELLPKSDTGVTPKTNEKKQVLDGFNKIVVANMQPMGRQKEVIVDKKLKKNLAMHSSINMTSMVKKNEKNKKKALKSKSGNVTLPEADHLESYRLPKISKKAKKLKDLCNLVDSPEFALIPNSSKMNGLMSQSSSHSREMYDSSQELDTTLISERNLGTPTIVEGTPKKMSSLPIASTPVLYSNKDNAIRTRDEDILSDFVAVDARNSGAVEIYHASSVVGNVNNLNTFDVEDNDYANNDNRADDEIRNISEVEEDVTYQDSTEDHKYQDLDDTSSTEILSNGDSDIDSQATISSTENLNIFENLESRRKPKFYSLQNKVVVIMEPECEFHFNGKLKVKVVYGTVEIYGSVLSVSDTLLPVEVYSPRGSSLVSIQTADEPAKGSLDDAGRLLITEGIDSTVTNDLQAEIVKCQTGQAVIILENLENTLTKFLDSCCLFKLFPKLEDSTNYPKQHPRKAEIVLQTSFQFGEQGRQLKSDWYWKVEIANRLLERWTSGKPTCALIAGGKGVGKSTMLRYVVNNLLSKIKTVVVVDLDPGQAEFSPPGCISLNLVEQPLMGPNFTHLKMPFYQLYIGDTNVIHCIPRYVKGVKKLIDYLVNCQRLSGLPVIVNTMGFCKGIGLDIMMYIIKLILPTNVIQIISERAKNNFNDLLSSEVVNRQDQIQIAWDKDSPIWKELSYHTLHTVPSQAEVKQQFGDCWEMEPRQQRDVVMLAYLSQIIRDDGDSCQLRLYKPLSSINDMVPYIIPFSDLSISLTRTSVPASHILATINGNIVALCGIDAKKDFTQIDDTTDSSYPRTLIRTPLSTCYGFGIIRGIDMEKGHVFVNTPLSTCEMQFVNCFVGCIPMPATMLLLDHHGVPYIGGQDDLPTSREPRRGYFRMRQQNTPHKAKLV